MEKIPHIQPQTSVETGEQPTEHLNTENLSDAVKQYGTSIIERLSEYTNEEQCEIANKLIEVDKGKSVAKYLDKFEGLNHPEIANKLFEAGNGEYVASYLERFQGLNHSEIANKLIEAGKGQSVAAYLGKFQGLDSEIANKLIEAGQGQFVAACLNNFEGLNHSEIANKLIEAGKGQSVANNLERFQGLNHSEIANTLIEAGKGWSVANYLHEFQGLDSEIANKLIEAGQGQSVAACLERFKGLNHSEIANKLIEAGQGEYVAAYLERFQGLNHSEIANKLIEAGKGQSVANNLERFQGLNHSEIANKLIEAGQGQFVAACLNNFEGLNHSEIANKLIEAGQGQSVVDNLDKFEGLNHPEIANTLIEAGQGNSVANNLERFQGLSKEVYVKLASPLALLGKYRQLSELLEMDWAPHMTSEQVQSIVESTEELRIRVNTIQAIFPESTAFQALFITSAIYDTFDTSIEAIKSMPLLGTHLEVNPRMAPRLISKIVEFDQTALEGLHRLHKIDSSKNAMGDISQSEGWKNTVMHDKLSSVLGLTQSRKNSYYEEPIGNGESEIPPLDLLASENRKINIKNLREYKNNPKILTAIETAGILSNDWLYYESETSFTISTGAEIELATNYIQSPLTRLIEENITTLATTFKEGFYNSIPSDMEVSHEFDDKQQELLQKLTTLQEAYHSSDDEKKKIGMQKGIASIEKMLREYKSPKMRDAINGMLGSITVQATRIVELRKEQALAQAETGARNIEYIQRIKRIDQSILDQTKSLILRLKKAKTYIESIAEQMKISYDIFETKELFEHIQEDSQAIMSTLETLESGENTALVGREMTIGICNRNPYSSLYLGNYTGCCVSIEGEIHGAESPIIDYLTDLGMQIVTVVDTTKREKPVPIAAIWTYIGEMDGEPVMQIDNIETNTGYTDAHREQFTAEVQKYMEDYAQKLGLRLYQGTSYNDLVVAEFGHTNKLGGLYNRPDGYYLEAEEDEE